MLVGLVCLGRVRGGVDGSGHSGEHFAKVVAAAAAGFDGGVEEFGAVELGEVELVAAFGRQVLYEGTVAGLFLVVDAAFFT